MTAHRPHHLLAGALLLAVAVTPACKHDHDHGPGADHSHDDDHAKSSRHKGPDGKIPKAFELDDGKKWQMDDHTRASIKRMNELVTNAGDDHPALAAALEAELEVLIKGCTMKGPSHQQLHVFIAALFGRFAALKKGGKDGGIALLETRTLFERYQVAFE